MSMVAWGEVANHYWPINCVQTQNREVPELVIIDASQLLYHIVWPFRGHVSDIVESNKRRLSPMPGEKILVFDKYHDLSAKDHERVRRAGIGSTKYNLTVNTQLPNREAIMRNKHSKLVLSHVLSTYSFGGNVTVESHSDGIFKHDEAYITMISHFLLAADSGTKCIRILSDDTDVFVLLIYWVYRHSINATVQLEWWDGSVWDINATCAQLGPKFLLILGMHYLTGSDTTSYLYGKGKVSALKTLRAGDFPGLHSVLGEQGARQAQLLEVGQGLFCSQYGQPAGTTMGEARYRLYPRKCGRPQKLVTSTNWAESFPAYLACRSPDYTCQISWQIGPPALDITKYGWEIKDGVPAPVTSTQPLNGRRVDQAFVAAIITRCPALFTVLAPAGMPVWIHSRPM